MKKAILLFRIPCFLSPILLAAISMIVFGSALAAQGPASHSVDAQIQAMRKLSFLTGYWSGPISIFRGSGDALHLTQTEVVAYKLGGLVLLIEGRSNDAENRPRFSALATVAYDDVSRGFRFRAYNDGHYLDTELSVLPKGFSWGFAAGPAYIVNTMQLTEKGKWKEVTDVSVSRSPQEHSAPHRSMEMLLQRRP